jgi:hypothetical protein
MEETGPKKVKEENLPWFYRLILKIPGTSFLENAGGIFWAILVPIFLIAEFFLSMYLLLSFSFPANIILTSIIPVVTFALFMKITFKRYMNWLNTIYGESGFEWNVEKTLNDYLALLKKNREEELKEKS